jgi:hypothetical protein
MLSEAKPVARRFGCATLGQRVIGGGRTHSSSSLMAEGVLIGCDGDRAEIGSLSFGDGVTCELREAERTGRDCETGAAGASGGDAEATGGGGAGAASLCAIAVLTDSRRG